MVNKKQILNKPDEYWRQQLSEEEYRVCRQQGTEAPFTGKLLHNKQTGLYHCTCCQAALLALNINMTLGAAGRVSMRQSVKRRFGF